MDKPYVSEFCACIRHPVHEAGQESTFHVVVTRWFPDLDGTMKPHAFGPITPEAAAKHGFDLPTILGEVAAAAIRERDDALKLRDETHARLVKMGELRANDAREIEALRAALKTAETTAATVR